MFGYVDKYSRNSLCLESQKSLFQKKRIFLEFSKSPFLTIPENLEDFKDQHKKKFWYNLRRQERLYCEKYGLLKFNVFQDERLVNKFLPQVKKLFRERWKEEYTSLCWKNNKCFDAYSKEFLKKCLDQTAFLAVLTNEDDELLSYCYCLVRDDVVYLFQHTTDINIDLRTYSLGKLAIWKLINFLIKSQKYSKLDFMYGESSYKYEWTKSYERVFYVYRRSLHGIFLYLLSSCKLYLLRNITLKFLLKRLVKGFQRRGDV